MIDKMTLILIAILAVIIAILVYWLRREIRSNHSLHAHRMQIAEEMDQLRHRINSIVKVIEQSAGGVEKRITEHQEIVTAITNRHPALFNDEPGLLYWLNASDQFYRNLRSAVFEGNIFTEKIEENQDNDNLGEMVDAFFANIKAEMGREHKGPLTN